MTDLLGEIRARDENAVPLCTYRAPGGSVSATFSAEQQDRRTLLRLLDATREELADALGRIDRLTDRVIAAETSRTDAADLQRELDEMRRAWAGEPATEDAVAKLREWCPDYEAGAMMAAMPVATARKLLAALDGPYTWGESVTWTAGRILVPLNRDGASVADLELDAAGARELVAHLTGVLDGDLSIRHGLVHFPADWTEQQRTRFRAAWDEAQR